MTFKERLQIECPDDYKSKLEVFCPDDFEYKQCSFKECDGTSKERREGCWNRKIPVDDFKIGDKVKLRDGLVIGCEYDGVTLIDTMTQLKDIKITGFVGDKIDTGLFIYSKVMIEKVEERKEDMENLKEKMEITTLVQLEDGTLGIIFKNVYSEDGKGIYNPNNHGCITWLSDYTEDLIYPGNNRYNISKIKFPSIEDNYNIVHSFFKLKGKPSFDYLKWDWERKSPVTKDISIEELNAILKEKYPDVDTFNLPIKDGEAK